MINNQPLYSKRRHHRWRKEFNDLITGVSGGFLFGVPLLYTMEVWFIGSYVKPKILLLILFITFVLLFILNRVEGFRLSRSDYQTNLDAVAESVEALALGIILASITLVLLQRIDGQTSLSEILGKIVFEAVPFAFGVALSRLILSGERSTNQNNSAQNEQNRGEIFETLADFSATAIGAVIIAFSIAPTDEVAVIAASTSPPWLILVVVVSILVSYSIVFAAGFTTQAKRKQQRGLFQSPFSETIFCYLVSLFASMLMLWFFQRLTPDAPLGLWLRYTIILGLPATIGGAAGRLAI